MSFPRNIFTFAVLETFAGIPKVGEEVDVETGTGGGDCGYHFVIGERYLVDAFRNGDQLSTGICTLTAPEDAAALTLRELRAANAGWRVPDLSGIVLRRNPNGSLIPGVGAGVPGVPVTLTASDGTQLYATTEKDGVYQSPPLPPGDYTVAFDLPTNLMTDDFGSKPHKVSIPNSTGASPACHQSLDAYPAGKIPGRAVDPAGNGIPGFVAIYNRSPAQGRPFSWSAAGATDAGGNFTMAPLAAGTYWLEFNPEGQPQPTWYYPGTLNKEEAQPIVVEDGKTAPAIQLVVSVPQ
jgi:hypothetical protein